VTIRRAILDSRQIVMFLSTGTALLAVACGSTVPPGPGFQPSIEALTTTPTSTSSSTTTTTTIAPPLPTTPPPAPPAPPAPPKPVVTTTKTTPKPAPPPKPRTNCDPAYPTVCIPPAPPDLDCPDIPYKRFTVLNPDPHRFDADHDGIGCES
jgi:hypothetical protein